MFAATLRRVILPTHPLRALWTVHNHPACCSSLCGCGLPRALPCSTWSYGLIPFSKPGRSCSLPVGEPEHFLSLPAEPQRQTGLSWSQQAPRAVLGQAYSPSKRCGFLRTLGALAFPAGQSQKWELRGAEEAWLLVT